MPVELLSVYGPAVVLEVVVMLAVGTALIALDHYLGVREGAR